MSHQRLGVFIDMGTKKGTENRVAIEFRSRKQASSYHQFVSNTPLHGREALESRLNDRIVSMHLPSRIKRIVASVDMQGFYLVFSDTDLARSWVDSLPVWKRAPENEKWIYADRNMDDITLNALLGSPRRGVPSTRRQDPEPTRKSRKT